MRKIDLTPFKISGTEQEYLIKQTISGCLFHPDMKLSARDLISQDALARKIEGADGFVLLEESEYQMVKKSVEVQKGWQRGDLEFVQRILNAPEVPVKEAV